MAWLLDSSADDTGDSTRGANRVFVRQLPYDNAAAKFWTALLDEVLERHPDCDEIGLTAPTGGLLTPELLTPEKTLQRDLDRLGQADVRKEFEEILATLDVLGPPCPVVLHLWAKGVEQERRELPMECLDADVLPFLLAWLLEWAGLTEFAWNLDRVRGEFDAEDRDRQWRYRVSFLLQNTHLSEGLFEREVRLKHERVPLAVRTAPA